MVGLLTAAEQELAPLVPNAIQIVHIAGALVNALNLWINDKREWSHASKRVRNFAEQHFDTNVVRQQVGQKIESMLDGII